MICTYTPTRESARSPQESRFRPTWCCEGFQRPTSDACALPELVQLQSSRVRREVAVSVCLLEHEYSTSRCPSVFYASRMDDPDNRSFVAVPIRMIRVYSAASLSLWRDLQSLDDKRSFQHVIADMARIGQNLSVQYPEMYLVEGEGPSQAPIVRENTSRSGRQGLRSSPEYIWTFSVTPLA